MAERDEEKDQPTERSDVEAHGRETLDPLGGGKKREPGSEGEDVEAHGHEPVSPLGGGRGK